MRSEKVDAMPTSPIVGISKQELVRRNRIAFFWANVDRRGDDECWPWLRNPTNGYGQMRGFTRTIMAHRFAWELIHGDIPDGLTIDHLCHEADPLCSGGSSCLHRLCCNPTHLDLKTFADNVKQGCERRRAKSGNPVRVVSSRICEFPECKDNVYSRNLCVRHYRRLRRHGDPSVCKR